MFALVIIFIVYMLYKKGIINNYKFPIIKLGYFNHHNVHQVKKSYWLYNGIDKYPFIVKKNVEVTLTYNVSVQTGSLLLKLIDGNNIIFHEKFTSDNEGTFTFTPNSRTQVVTVIGSFTKGECHVEIIRQA